MKRDAASIFNCCRPARVLFFRMLNVLLLRSWHVRKEVKRWLRTAPAGARVLDAGSGFGQYVWFVSRLRKDLHVTGIDVKEEEIAICNRFFGVPSGTGEGTVSGSVNADRGPAPSGQPDEASLNGNRLQPGRVSFRKADLLGFSEPETYDLALCIDVLEHIEDDVKVMANLCRSLKPGGVLIISTPSDKGGSDVHREGDRSFIGEHVRDGYSSSEIADKLLAAGFSAAGSRYTYGRWGHISWYLSMKLPVKILNRGRIFFLVLPVYYIFTLPFALLLNFFDLWTRNRMGTGLLVRAVKGAVP